MNTPPCSEPLLVSPQEERRGARGGRPSPFATRVFIIRASAGWLNLRCVDNPRQSTLPCWRRKGATTGSPSTVVMPTAGWRVTTLPHVLLDASSTQWRGSTPGPVRQMSTPSPLPTRVLPGKKIDLFNKEIQVTQMQENKIRFLCFLASRVTTLDDKTMTLCRVRSVSKYRYRWLIGPERRTRVLPVNK